MKPGPPPGPDSGPTEPVPTGTASSDTSVTSDSTPEHRRRLRARLPELDPAVSTWGFGDVAGGYVLTNLAAMLVASVVVSVAGWRTASETNLGGMAAMQAPLWIGYTLTVVRAGRAKGRGVPADFGLRMRWYDAPVGLLVGFLMQMVVLPLIYWPLLELLGKDPDDLAAPAREIAERADGPLGWAVLALMLVGIAPFVEELFYRGLLVRSAQKAGWSTAAVVVGSAAIFGAVHLQPLQFAGLFALGLVLACATVLTGRLGPAIWIHVAFNATTVAVLYADAHG